MEAHAGEPTMRIAAVLFAAAVAGSAALAGCGSSSKTVAPTTLPPPSSASSSSASSTTAPASGAQSMTVTPSSGLGSPATVQVKASGFTPGESLVVIECANKGKATTQAECNLTGLEAVKAGSTGQVAAKFKVTKGPFGTSHVTCVSARSCVVSVTQETPSPTQEATAPISFK